MSPTFFTFAASLCSPMERIANTCRRSLRREEMHILSLVANTFGLSHYVCNTSLTSCINVEQSDWGKDPKSDPSFLFPLLSCEIRKIQSFFPSSKKDLCSSRSSIRSCRCRSTGVAVRRLILISDILLSLANCAWAEWANQLGRNGKIPNFLSTMDSLRATA